MHSYTAPGTESPSVPAASTPQSNNAPSVTALHNAGVQMQSAPAAAIAPAASTGFLTRGPWVVGGLYLVVPTGPLALIPEQEPAEEQFWYSITRGRYVGVTLSHSLALAAVSGVSRSSMKSYKTEVAAAAAFNEMLSYNLVAVLP
ncbi:hypothetical protein FB451DRAFT_1392011 [Mycena latifolia]|nr:hypothetical protein FB451DRAFT_1392011 [Mycena latifolia]